MTDIDDEKRWERDMVGLGIHRYRAMQEDAIAGQRYVETSAGNRLMKAYIGQVSEAIVQFKAKPGRKPLHLKLVQGVDADKLAYFTLYSMVSTVFTQTAAQKVASTIGVMVEDELRFSKFYLETPEFYNAILRDLDAKNSHAYRHRHRVLVNRMQDRNIEWHSWSNTVHVGVGMMLLAIAEEASDLVERVHANRKVYLRPTAEATEWIKQHDGAMELLLPDRMPTIVPPVDWDDWRHGGFHTNRLQKLTPLVKTRQGQHRDVQNELLDTAAMPTVLQSINAMQGTDWSINQDVLNVVKEVWDRGLGLGMPRSQPYEIPKCPIDPDKTSAQLNEGEKIALDAWKAEARVLHTLEAQRSSSLMNVVRVMRIAERMKPYELLWIVYQTDFRGRTYSTTAGVSPQGSDISKASLQFGTAKPLGERGWYWFKVHGANKFGNDKGTYDERVLWVESNRDHFIAAGNDPLAHTSVWKDADKPYQFLAWCIEYARACARSNPAEFKSRLPIALDGSCNGLQHFSAMLRDPIGGRSVNLVPSEHPADIYQDVADVATEKLRDIASQPDHEHVVVAQNWLALFDHMAKGKGMNRKLSKKPVMTLPYGSTQQTCTQSVYEWYIGNELDFFPENTAFKHSIFLSGVLWQSIGEVVVAAREAMKWLQVSARILAKDDHIVHWDTPIGFPMVQVAANFDQTVLETSIGGRLRLTVRFELPGIDSYRAGLGVSPNIVHAVDATHLHMTVAECKKLGIDHFAMIHDDFGVHACHVDTLHRVLREQFVKLHSETDILADFKEQTEMRAGVLLPKLPSKGDLDLGSVLDSPYFFG